MPGFLTHYLFSINTYHALKKKTLQDIIKEHKQVYFLGAQGPDIFFYYLPCNLNKKKQLGSTMHHTCTSDFFHSCLKEIPKLKEESEREIALAYVSGFLCHYTLDSISHPFIYARTDYDRYVKEVKAPLSYGAEHCNYETKIDSNMLKRYKKTSPSKMNYKEMLKITKQETLTLASFLTDTINSTYFKENGYSYVNESFIKRTLKYMPYELKLLQDKYGWKRPAAYFLEKYTVKFHLLSGLITTDRLFEDEDVLNLKKESWASPWVPDLLKDETFVEIFECGAYRLDSLSSAWSNLENPEVYASEVAKLVKHLGNLSYNSGLDWRLG